MNITFLGGGNEIGASSAIVEIGSARILIDCGIRMSGDHRLPDLAAISQTHAGQLDAVLLTHAHMDHSGALPVLHQHFPGVPVYATAPTRGLVEVLLRDSINIMRARAESEQELPLYSQPAVESLLEKMIPTPFGSPMEIGRTGVTATWFPAGHILGASSIGVEGVEQGRSIRVLFSGDIAVADQLTVPGMLPPAAFRPDVLVIEATYGDRMHSPRELEEQRLIEMVAGIIEQRGKLLIPAFAIGRAQEVTLMLLKQFRSKKLASFPVWIDGMVKTVCGVYSQFPAHQTPYSRRLIEKHGNPFFNIVDEIRQVTSPAEREKVLSGDPCVIIASSGMLTGGASAFYAQHLVNDERNGIAITGYQDEESPGRQLLALAEAETREASIAGKTLAVKCGVEKYSLSAHADCNEIAGLIEAINPREVVLVHGEGRSRESLRDLLRKQGARYRPIHLPRTGDTLNFGAIRRVTQPESVIELSATGAQPTIGGGEPLTSEGLRRMAARLRERGEEGKLFSEIELLNLWFGENGWDEERFVELIRLLDDSEDFRRPKARPHRYRLLRPEEKGEIEDGIFFATPQEILSRVEKLLGPETGLYHKGYDIATRTLRLMFEFPDLARQRYVEQFEAVVTGTGWSYAINDKPHQGRLAEVALESLPQDLQMLRGPAIHLETKEVAVKLGALLDRATADAAMAAFHERTGWRLRLQMPATATSGQPVSELAATEATPQVAQPRVIEESELEFRPGVGGRPLNEIAATAEIEEAFSLAPETWRPSRVKLKTDESGDYLELAFLTPELGLRQRRTMQAMANATGRRLRIRPHVNTYDLVEIARNLAPKEWRLLKQPSLRQDQGVVRIKVAAPPAPEEFDEVCERFDEMTGFRLEVVV
ncbi:MAG TPA: MBL fold metallo-hydrolase [Blastocatellia bacterium]|nr:MBL fold metallo-hydrolase [Blastocatellia bacterium]